MQLMDKAQFLTMPPETIFSRFYPELMTGPYDSRSIQPVAFGDLCIKGKSHDGEFEFTDLVDNCVAQEETSGFKWKSVKAGIAIINRFRQQFDSSANHKSYDLVLDEGHGSFEELYAVWDSDDVRNLTVRLSRIKQAPHVRPLPALLSTVDELVANWVMVEDSAATS